MLTSRTQAAIGGLFGFHRPVFRLETTSLPITDLGQPSLLSFPLLSSFGEGAAPLVKKGDAVTVGQPLAACGEAKLLPSPVQGEVAAIGTAPDLRGGTFRCAAVMVKPAAEAGETPLAALDADKAEVAAIRDRIAQAGVLTDSERPRPLGERLCPESGRAVDTLVVIAVDREPLVSTRMAVFKERGADAAQAARMLGRVAGASRTALAVIAPLADEAKKVCQPQGVEVIAVEPIYPRGLNPLIALDAGARGKATVVGLEAALAALDAVRKGELQNSTVLTVIGPDGEPRGNYRVALGTPIRDIFRELGLHPEEHDKVTVGGPMRGTAQYSLDGAIDAGVDALMLIPAAKIVPWSDEPCVNCGKCLEICPVTLQVHLICRYSEFALFDRTAEYEIEQCVECGLCAATCIARRPLLQFIRLAKDELAKQREAQPPAAAE